MINRKDFHTSPEDNHEKVVDVSALSKTEIEEIISALKVHEEELQRQNELLQDTQVKLEKIIADYFDLYHSAPVGYITSDAWGKVLQCNKSMADYFAVKTHDIINGNFNSWCVEKDAFYLHCRKVVNTEKPIHSEIQCRTVKSGIIYFAVDSTQHETKDGVHIRSVFTDITERIKMEQNIIQKNELLEAANKKAEESEKLKSAFLANMSHEIRTPIGGILGIAKLLEKQNLDENKRTQYIEILKSSSRRLLGTVNDILEVSIIESGKSFVHPTKFNLTQFLDEIVKFHKLEFENKGIRLKFVNNVAPENAMVQLDENKLASIVNNLLKNALKFTNEGFVELGINKSQNHIYGYVKDTGIGVPESKRALLFQRFGFNTKVSNDKHSEGSGLGLSIVNSYTQMMGGEVSFEPNIDGYGSTFKFYVQEIETKVLPDAKSFDVNLPENIIDFMTKANVLVVDDDEVSAYCLKDHLQDRVKSISTVTNGQDAVDFVHNNEGVDLILMDLKMPIMDGYEATKAIRKFNSKVIIIAQSAHVFVEFKEKALESGCNDFMSKPVEFENLVNCLSGLLNSTPNTH